MSKLTLEVSDELNEILNRMSTQQGLAKTQILRRAVKLMDFFDEAAMRKEQIVLRNPVTKTEQLLILESHL